ncbi:helicase [Streptomyces goshikiensis]
MYPLRRRRPNTKQRRDKLTAEQLDALRKLGVQWT